MYLFICLHIYLIFTTYGISDTDTYLYIAPVLKRLSQKSMMSFTVSVGSTSLLRRRRREDSSSSGSTDSSDSE